ncbi:Phosphoenolpyruvate-dependent sugar phosphotransferase system, EIIA 2 [Raoultella planticola]|uniref:Phosphoenolpyruvate-dependent sugar phosphotransferase system, EIIA 2 n=1 Tax=Raoultella planticola TaxID=575 RepID=A0A485BBE1_RAOPL|nr:Phosphoenolpyruvate-dependent sugar phosphotransferase system, EIIA 2 [Raoultella planticola]
MSRFLMWMFEHIKEEKLVVVTCPEGIEFKQAEDPDEVMSVQVIFFLLLKEKDAHIDFLMKMIGLFRQTDKMDAILKSQFTFSGEDTPRRSH